MTFKKNQFKLAAKIKTSQIFHPLTSARASVLPVFPAEARKVAATEEVSSKQISNLLQSRSAINPKAKKKNSEQVHK